MDNDQPTQETAPDYKGARSWLKTQIVGALVLMVVFAVVFTLFRGWQTVMLLSEQTGIILFGGVALALLMFLKIEARRARQELFAYRQAKRVAFQKALDTEREKQLGAFRAEKEIR